MRKLIDHWQKIAGLALLTGVMITGSGCGGISGAVPISPLLFIQQMPANPPAPEVLPASAPSTQPAVPQQVS